MEFSFFCHIKDVTSESWGVLDNEIWDTHLFGGGNATKSHATARGLQLPICSIDQRGQQLITDE